MQMAEEERRVMMELTSLDMENNQVNAANLVIIPHSTLSLQTALKQLSIDQISDRLFYTFSTWLIREPESCTTSVSSASTLKTLSELRDLHKKKRTVSNVSTLHDSSIGVDSDELSEDYTTHSSQYERESQRVRKLRVMGHVDFEKCIREILPRCSKSQCVTKANRLFEKVVEGKTCVVVCSGTICKQIG